MQIHDNQTGSVEEVLSKDRQGLALKILVSRFRQEALRIQNQIRRGASLDEFNKANRYLLALEAAESSLAKYWERLHRN